jgi:hypothetical protein
VHAELSHLKESFADTQGSIDVNLLFSCAVQSVNHSQVSDAGVITRVP